MAYTSVVRVQRLDNSIRYILNPGKTEQGLFQSALDCTCETAFEDMRQLKKIWHKEGGVQGYHLIQSFAAGEVTGELAHQVGVELAERLLGGRFQVVVSTHVNTGHLHNHILWNSVGEYGQKYHSSYKSYLSEIRRISDELCLEHGLSVIHNGESERVGKSYAEWLAEQNGQQTWKDLIRKDVDNAVISALSWNQFLKILAQQGYQFQLHRKYITLQPPGNARPVRFKTLGRNYTPEAIHRRILAPKRRRTTWINPSFSQIKLKGKSPRKLTGLQALYFSYLYKMGILRKKPRRTAAARADIRRMDKLLAQLKFIRENGLRSREQAAELQEEKETELPLLLERRRQLYRRKAEPAELEVINELIREKRKVVKMCREILEETARNEIVKGPEKVRKQEIAR